MRVTVTNRRRSNEKSKIIFPVFFYPSIRAIKQNQNAIKRKEEIAVTPLTKQFSGSMEKRHKQIPKQMNKNLNPN